MPVRFLLALMLLVLGVPAAQAASFDCAKASTPFEKAICSDAALSAQDEVLAVAWKTAVGGLSKTANDVMLQGQRDWLGFLDKVCADDMLPGEDKPEVERVSCLSNLYTTRIRTLEGSRMLGGLRFYQTDTYSAAPDPEGEAYYRIATNTASAPLIDGATKESRAFNAMIAEETAGASPAEITSEGDDDAQPNSSDSDLTLSVAEVNDARIDIDVSSYWYGHGAAHGNYAITYRHFLREPGRLLEAADIFAGKNWQQHLADLTLKRLKEDRGELIWDIDPAWLKEAVADPTRWKFTGNGIVIQFQPYEVASYADGAVTAEIAWNLLEGDLAENASALTY